MKMSQPVGASWVGRGSQRALRVLLLILFVGAISGCGAGDDGPSGDRDVDSAPGVSDVVDGDVLDVGADVDGGVEDARAEDAADASDVTDLGDAPEECDAGAGECSEPIDLSVPLPDGMCPSPAGCGGIRQIALGDDFACVLSVEGEVRCWGQNSTGQLGNGVESGAGEDTPQPILVGGALSGKPVSAITAGSSHACALVPSYEDESGTGDSPSDPAVYCWGRQSMGLLGNGNLAGNSEPILVALSQAEGSEQPLVPSALMAGQAHTCLLDDAQNIRCWGSNYNAQLGTGERGPQPGTSQSFESSTDYPVSTNMGQPDGSGAVWLADMAAIRTQEFMTCAWGRVSSSFWCWGGGVSSDMDWGRFAQEFVLPSAGAQGNQPPTIVIDDVAPGSRHTCIVTRDQSQAEVKRDIYCWGANINFTYPDDTRLVLELPGRDDPESMELFHVGLSPELLGQAAPSSLVSGSYFSCLIGAEGKVYCWGMNSYGQLGLANMSSVDRNNGSPVLFDDIGNGFQPLTDIVALSAGHYYVCGLSARGEVWCWGNNTHGQLGSPTERGWVGTCNAETRFCRPYARKVSFED